MTQAELALMAAQIFGGITSGEGQAINIPVMAKVAVDAAKAIEAELRRQQMQAAGKP